MHRINMHRYALMCTYVFACLYDCVMYITTFSAATKLAIEATFKRNERFGGA